jgi:hypothetical protein
VSNIEALNADEDCLKAGLNPECLNGRGQYLAFSVAITVTGNIAVFHIHEVAGDGIAHEVSTFYLADYIEPPARFVL